MEHQRVLVVGTGKSGIAAAEVLLEQGKEVLLYDSRENIDAEAIREKFSLEAAIYLIKGELRPEQIEGVELAVISPGIPLDQPFVQMLKQHHVTLWGELELGYHGLKGELCAITGTNGKTTTTSLVGEILKTQYEDVHVGGNIGIPFSKEAETTKEHSVTVAEVSSFMLETIEEFRPHVSAILNITPDHLDRHKTMEEYIRCKEEIARNQKETDWIVLNYEDEVLRAFGEQTPSLKPRVIFFSSQRELKEGFFLRGDEIIFRESGEESKLLNVKELTLLGRHNYENVMAAMAVSLKMGVEMEKIIEACKAFKAVEHRIEFVREHSGVRYYNDSKGTNPDAAIQALRAMPGPTLLIAGGYDKHSEYDEWIEAFGSKVKLLVLMGQTKEKIAECAKKHGFETIVYVEDMEEAVRRCADAAESGDYVLLSPACASWGMFKDYEQRGRIFKDAVHAL